jgi:excisionase family DNA binding protein
MNAHRIEPLLRTSEVAKILRISRGTVRTWRRRGLIRGFRIGRDLRFRRSDVEAVLSGASEAGSDTREST